jgi:hypothetical protein
MFFLHRLKINRMKEYKWAFILGSFSMAANNTVTLASCRHLEEL